MFCWPCIVVYQYNETNMMHFSFSLLRIKGLYVFRALLSHPQEALHKRHSVYCVKLQPCHSQLTLYARSIPNAVCVSPPEDEQVMLETCRGLWFSTNWMKSASRWFHYTDVPCMQRSKFLAHFLWTSNSMDVEVFPILGLYGTLVGSYSQNPWR
jgi:hypothetical protein